VKRANEALRGNKDNIEGEIEESADEMNNSTFTMTKQKYCEYLVADCLVDEADKAHVSDMPSKADVVGVEIEIARSLFKRSPKTSWGI
jgi:hypothetical protein